MVLKARPAAPRQNSSVSLGSHKWDKDPMCGRICSFSLKISQPISVFCKNFAGIACSVTQMKMIFFAYIYTGGARSPSWVLGGMNMMGCVAAHTCSTGCVYPSPPRTDLLEAIYSLWSHHPLFSLRCWSMWTYHVVKPFSLPLATKVWPVHVNQDRKVSCDQMIMGQVLDWIWTPESKTTPVPDGAQMFVYDHIMACPQLWSHTIWWESNPEQVDLFDISK